MKKILTLALLGASLFFASCGDTPSNAQNNVTVSYNSTPQQNVNVQANDIPGFNVNAFAQLLKSTTNPDALTQAINSQGNNINNLDLDNDGNIDYLKVDQISNNSLGVYDELPTGKVQVATLTVNTQNNSYVINGTPDYCGPTYVYQSQPGLSFGQYMFLAWMLRPHAYYHPYWGYHSGYYRGYGYYHSHYSRPYSSSYIIERRTITRTNRITPSATSSYRPAQTPSRTSVSNATSSQRSFNSGEGNRFRSSGASSNGFRSSGSSGFKSSSSRSFGSSRSSFGGGRRR